MAISQGVSKRVAYKKETNWGELPGATGAKESAELPLRLT